MSSTDLVSRIACVCQAGQFGLKVVSPSTSSDAYWIDLGTPEKYLQAHFDMLDGKVGSAPHYATPFVADSAAVQDGARLGRRAVVCARARIERGAVLEDSVVHPHAIVEEGATVRSSILGPRSRVGAGAVVNRSVLAEGAAVPAGSDLLRLSGKARALLTAKVGDTVTLRAPRGPERLEIIARQDGVFTRF